MHIVRIQFGISCLRFRLFTESTTVDEVKRFFSMGSPFSLFACTFVRFDRCFVNVHVCTPFVWHVHILGIQNELISRNGSKIDTQESMCNKYIVDSVDSHTSTHSNRLQKRKNSYRRQAQLHESTREKEGNPLTRFFCTLCRTKSVHEKCNENNVLFFEWMCVVCGEVKTIINVSNHFLLNTHDFNKSLDWWQIIMSEFI